MNPVSEDPRIWEKDGKYFREDQIPWSEATPEERSRWACYQQTHTKRFVEIKKEEQNNG